MSYLARKEEKMEQRYPHKRSKRENGKPKSENQTDGKGNGGSVRFDFLEPSGNGPVVEEVSGNQVNVAPTQVDISDISQGAFLGNQKLAR